MYSGGGPGNYGVVVSLTVKTYADAVVSGAKLSVTSADNGNSSDLVFTAVDTFHAALPGIVDFGSMVIYYYTTEYLSVSALTAFNKTQAQLEEAMSGLIASLDSLGLTYTTNFTEAPTYLEHYNHYWGPIPEGWIQVGTDQFGGRLISRSQLANFSTTARAIAEEGAIFIGVGTNVGPFDAGDNAVLPGWRDAVVSASLELPFSFTDPWSDAIAAQDLITDVIQPIIEAATPGSGAYMNEADWRQPDFQEAFFGSNYETLLAVKNKWDPNGFFYAAVSVGSEAWTVAFDGRMCKA